MVVRAGNSVRITVNFEVRFIQAIDLILSKNIYFNIISMFAYNILYLVKVFTSLNHLYILFCYNPKLYCI